MGREDVQKRPIEEDEDRMILGIEPGAVYGLEPEARRMLDELLHTYQAHESANRTKAKYYEGKIPLSEVNLGIALPHGMDGLEIGCAWGAKCVDVLAARSMFDGFVNESGEDIPELDSLVNGNRLITEYSKATRDELKYGSTFATLSADHVIGCKIRFHSPRQAAARWDGEKGRIAYGFAIIDEAPDNEKKDWKPNLLNLYTDDAVWVLHRDGERWFAEYHPQKMGRPLMEPMIWNATSDKPFGRSRIKEPIRRLIQGYVRTIANASIGLEFSTAPQKYLMGVSDDMYDTLVNDKFRQYVGSILAATTNPDNGEKPSFGQLPQGTISPHVEMLKILAAQFGAATGLSVTDTGVVNDSNPTSADAITAATQTLVSTAEALNTGNGDALKTIILMAQAIAGGKTMEELEEEQTQIYAHFRNPSMPSIAQTSDAAVKIATARKSFAETDVFLEMLGFSPADIRRIKNQERRGQGLATLEEMGI